MAIPPLQRSKGGCSGRDVRFIARPPQHRIVRAAFPRRRFHLRQVFSALRAGRDLRRQNHQGCETGQSTGGAAHDIPGGVEYENGASARPDDLIDAARNRRRGDRMRASFAALHESAFGTKRTSPDDLLFVRFWGEADLHCQPALIASDAIDPKRT